MNESCEPDELPFEQYRGQLRAVAYRMLGSLSDAEDAVQETWLRLNRADTREVANLGGWLTTVVSRVCLDLLRSRTARREEPLDGDGEPDRAVPRPNGPAVGADPEQEALLAESVGLALLVVLDRLTPLERLAFVLHDLFAVSFEEIAPIVDRSPISARQLASRARRRVRGTEPVPDPRLKAQREVVDAWLAASRRGDFAALLDLLDPDVVLRRDQFALPLGAPLMLRGASAVAGQASAHAELAQFSRTALVSGSAGIVTAPFGRLRGALVMAIRDGRVTEIRLITDPAALADLEIAVLD